jgi:hypothetical protein
VSLGGVGHHVVMVDDREPEPAQVGWKGVGAGVLARQGLGRVPARAIASLAVVRRGRGNGRTRVFARDQGIPGGLLGRRGERLVHGQHLLFPQRRKTGCCLVDVGT